MSFLLSERGSLRDAVWVTKMYCFSNVLMVYEDYLLDSLKLQSCSQFLTIWYKIHVGRALETRKHERMRLVILGTESLFVRYVAYSLLNGKTEFILHMRISRRN